MALQMSLDEISMAKSRSLTNPESGSGIKVPLKDIQENTNKITDIPAILPK